VGQLAMPYVAKDEWHIKNNETSLRFSRLLLPLLIGIFITKDTSWQSIKLIESSANEFKKCLPLILKAQAIGTY
jgi:hypothetical protein